MRDYDVVDRAITDTTTKDTRIETIYDETNIIDDRKVVRDNQTTIDKTTIKEDKKKPKDGGPKKPQQPKEQCICEICTCG